MKKGGPRRYPALFVFVVLLAALSTADLCRLDRTFSELENKALAQRPVLSVTCLLNNRWTADYNTYIKDQFCFRDAWIGLYSRCESLLLGKREVGGILDGAEHMQFARVYSLSDSEQRQLSRNIQAVCTFAERYSGRVSFLLAPTAGVIYRENLPSGVPSVDEDAWIDAIFDQVGPGSLDIRPALLAAKEQYLYYRTDHHWTTLGAFQAYQIFCAEKGLTPFRPEAHEACLSEGFYGTHYSSSRLWDTRPDTIIYYPLENAMTVYEVLGENQFREQRTTGLYDLEKLDTRDQYAMFLYGNNGYSSIQGSGSGSILVVKDSFANCFVPFLTENYERIDVVDLRGYPYGLDSLIEERDYDEILVLYGFQSFKSDPYLPNLMRAAETVFENGQSA